jgi:hypothetical protein
VHATYKQEQALRRASERVIADVLLHIFARGAAHSLDTVDALEDDVPLESSAEEGAEAVSIAEPAHARSVSSDSHGGDSRTSAMAAASDTLIHMSATPSVQCVSVPHLPSPSSELQQQ